MFPHACPMTQRPSACHLNTNLKHATALIVHRRSPETLELPLPSHTTGRPLRGRDPGGNPGPGRVGAACPAPVDVYHWSDGATVAPNA